MHGLFLWAKGLLLAFLGAEAATQNLVSDVSVDLMFNNLLFPQP
jgi:hypothetical protein